MAFDWSFKMGHSTEMEIELKGGTNSRIWGGNGKEVPIRENMRLRDAVDYDGGWITVRFLSNDLESEFQFGT
jgi:hypothetical protein